VLQRLPEQPGDVRRTFADVTRAREALGYAPRISIEEGIPMFVDWFRRQRAGAAANR
jgi:UDP-glucuronate 4-epimerase